MSLREFLIAGLACVTLLCAAGCDRDSGEADRSRPAPGQLGQAIYPGASLILPFERRDGLLLKADGGSLVWTPDGQSANYIAPVEQGNYGYTVIDSDDDDVLASGRVTVTIEPAAKLGGVEITENSLAAEYGDVIMMSVLDGETAMAVFSAGDDSAELVVTVDADGTGSLSFNGVELDGYGPLTPEEAEALHAIATGPLGRAVTMMPLDLGCAENNEVLNDQVFAPVLMPWQMILKYQVSDREPVIRHFLSQSECGFPGRLEIQPENPFNRLVLWDADHVIPSVHLYFPFDGDGQLPSLGN